VAHVGRKIQVLYKPFAFLGRALFEATEQR